MNGYQYIHSLFKSILLQSKQIQGRTVWMPEGDELNYDEFKRVLSEVTGPGAKFPVAAIRPPRSSGKFVPKYDEWEEYRMEMFFLNTTYYTGTNQTSKPNSGTRTSSKSVIEEWDDMKVAAVDFLRVLQLVLKGNNSDSVNMLNSIQLSSKEKFIIDPISFTGTQRLSGVRLSFIIKIFTNCLIQDYVDGGLIVLPESDDCTFDADLVVVRNEVLNILNEYGITPDGQLIEAVAGENVSSGRVVYIDAGKAYYYDPADETLAGKVVGLTKNASVADGNVKVIISGKCNIPGFGLSADAVYYVGANGVPVTSISGLKVIQKAGVAINSDNLVINFSSPIITN